MAISKTSKAALTIPEHPERLGAGLAHIIKVDNEREAILGQAWLAAPDSLVTCAHVVEQFVQNLACLTVRFPSSGKSYAIESIKLHPSFVRQPDQLVKFDLALLKVSLSYPETEAALLPFSFEYQLKPNQPISVLRYPVHLGQLTSAPEPLAQEGRFLGFLRKHDNFHWLHDLPLAPGDSGAALFCMGKVVAIHCGDTATLPGLNLPTTSIRLCLWIDALRDLGLSPSARDSLLSGSGALVRNLLAFFLAVICTLGIFYAQKMPGLTSQWTMHPAELKPVDVFFNKPKNGFKFGDNLEISLVPRSECYLYLFDLDKSNKVKVLYPPYGFHAFVKAGTPRTIDRFGANSLGIDRDKDKFHIVALISDWPIVRGSDWSHTDPGGQPLTIDGEELADRIQHLEKLDPNKIMHVVMDAPTAK